MDFRYTEEQQALQETLQRFIARDYGFEQRRKLAASPPGFSEAAWAQYAELGLLGLPFPEDCGDLALIFLRHEFVKTGGDFAQNRIDPAWHAIVRVHLQFNGCTGLFS